jgi:hypothetical protein
MTALVLENRRSARPNDLRGMLTHFARWLDGLVSARAARSVPEWQMREVQVEIARHVGLMYAAKLRRENPRRASCQISP